jgi:predicted O-methyltransferase YrrM
LLARAVDARRVFEFGSGFGYPAYWFARALPADGEVVALLAGESVSASEGSRGVADYISFVRGRDNIDTVLLPLGEGVVVSRLR